jgi:hypothetical protein
VGDSDRAASGFRWAQERSEAGIEKREAGMPTRQRTLLTLDGIVNMVLGLALILAPAGVARVLCLPSAGSYFYAVVLGAVLIGIGVALFISRTSPGGLGLRGAIVINLCGAAAVAIWLILAPEALCTRGLVILWAVAAIVFGIAIVELTAKA